MSYRAGYQKHGGVQHAVDEVAENASPGRFHYALCGSHVKVSEAAFDQVGGPYRRPCKRCLRSYVARERVDA